MSDVTVIDYGIGNVLSVCRAIEHCGATCDLTSDPVKIAGADRVVLPGVGAFSDGMRRLAESGLIDPIRRFSERGRPLLGICLGMQMLLDASEEFGEHQGLGLIPGRVVGIPKVGRDGKPHRIPHIGWSGIAPCAPHPQGWQDTLLRGIPSGACVYFVHSFMANPQASEARLADANCNGVAVAAAISRGSITGVQFHPEKSGRVGLQMVGNFLRL